MIAESDAAEPVAFDEARDDADVTAASPDEWRALIAALAEGRRRTTADLSAIVFGRADALATQRIRAALDALQDTGMPLVRRGATVETEPFYPLDARTLGQLLPDWRVDIAASIGSTNGALLERVRLAPGAVPALIAAEIQFAGRGRLGRRWTSAPGASLTASFALVVGRRLSALAGISLACGLAVRDAIAAHGVKVGLKWPNDLLVDGRKLGGILVEAHPIDARTAIVVGVGLNVSKRIAAPNAAGLSPIDLAACGGERLDRNVLAAGVARALERRMASFGERGFAAFVDEWNAVDAFRGRAVVLRSGLHDAAIVESGVACGVDAQGALVLDGDEGPRRIVNGDLSLRPAAAA